MSAANPTGTPSLWSSFKPFSFLDARFSDQEELTLKQEQQIRDSVLNKIMACIPMIGSAWSKSTRMACRQNIHLFTQTGYLSLRSTADETAIAAQEKQLKRYLQLHQDYNLCALVRRVIGVAVAIILNTSFLLHCLALGYMLSEASKLGEANAQVNKIISWLDEKQEAAEVCVLIERHIPKAPPLPID